MAKMIKQYLYHQNYASFETYNECFDQSIWIIIDPSVLPIFFKYIFFSSTYSLLHYGRGSWKYDTLGSTHIYEDFGDQETRCYFSKSICSTSESKIHELCMNIVSVVLCTPSCAHCNVKPNFTLAIFLHGTNTLNVDQHKPGTWMYSETLDHSGKCNDVVGETNH